LTPISFLSIALHTQGHDSTPWGRKIYYLLDLNRVKIEQDKDSRVTYISRSSVDPCTLPMALYDFVPPSQPNKSSETFAASSSVETALLTALVSLNQ